MAPPMTPHVCVLPALWRTRTLEPDTLWRCTCGRLHRLNNAQRGGGDETRFVDITDTVDAWPVAV